MKRRGSAALGLLLWAGAPALAALVACTAAGCAASPAASLQHVVLIKLRSADEVPELLADTRRHLAAVPSVANLWVGRPFELGRPGVDLDWDVGVIVGFADRAAYEAYLLHPEHEELVEAWRPRWEWIRVHDLVVEPPGAGVEPPAGGV